MEKSSSSLKRKRSKKVSKAKLSSRSKKIRKNKSKKVRRQVSLSSSDYDDSRSLDISASSSSEDNRRKRRDRSSTRKDVKSRKRKARGRSYSLDSSEDSHYARKRKKVKRKNERDEARKKRFQKKKIRREASVDLTSSRSQSCSTCQDGSASSDDNRYKNHRGRSERKEKDRRLRGRSGSKRSSRYRARSCSSCSSENSFETTKEKYVGEKNSRRLRSVITVTKEVEEYGELCRNETKEEIVDDHDYPCRSNDSNDGGTKRELDHNTHLASEETLSIDNEAGDMNADLNFTEPGLRDRSYNDSSNLKAYSSGTSESAKEVSETSGANVNNDDLEKILRQRALENLRKFRGEMLSSAKAPGQKNKIVSQVKQPITDILEPVQGKSVVNNAVVGTKFDKRIPGEEINLPVGRRTLIASPRNNERILDTDTDKVISASAKCSLASAPEKVIDSHNRSGTVTESTNYNTTNLELAKQTQIPCLDSFQTSASHEPTNAKLLETEGDVERNAAKTPHAAIQSINNGRNGDVSSVENKSDKLQVESNQGSQFEKKTMNVMRGGEMVQVSYKVYIPNKVPALARRQLKR